MLLEGEAEDGEQRGVEASACALLAHSPSSTACGLVTITWGRVPLLHALEAAVHVCGGIDPARCVVSWNGITYFVAGDNVVRVAAVDSEGDVVESIEEEDVYVSLSAGHTSVVSVSVGVAGVIEVLYHMPEGSAAPFTLGVMCVGRRSLARLGC